MSILDNYLTDIANIIRIKKDTNEAIKPKNFVNKIASITTLKRILDINKNCSGLIAYYKGDDLNELINYEDTENVTNFNSMFYKCSKATSFPLIDTSNGTNFGYMYGECKATTFPLIDTSKGTNFELMYTDCTKATLFPLINTSNGTKFSGMYQNCDSATSFPAIDTSKGTNFHAMYYSCNSATELPLIDTSNGTDFSMMYIYCSKATKFPPLNTLKATSLNNTYASCTSAIKLDISHYNCVDSYYSEVMCSYCRSLKAFIIRSFGSSLALSSDAFGYCSHMLGTYHETYNPDGVKDGYVYVPRNMIGTLQNTSVWKQLQFRALEDYTVDGTTTGELDDIKAMPEEFVEKISDKIYLTDEAGTHNITITLSNFINVPNVSITSSDDNIITISNITANTENITFDINTTDIIGVADVSVSVVGDVNYEYSFTVNITKYVEPTYHVENLSNVTYGFELNDDGYYVSTNSGVNSSYSLCKVVIDNPNVDKLANMYMDCINRGTYNTVYGVLSLIDTPLSLSNSRDDATKIHQSFASIVNVEPRTVSYNLPNGQHFIYVKYLKPYAGSNGSGEDVFKFKIRFDKQ